MEDKQREARLLQRQRRNHPTKLKFSGKVEVTEAETTDLKECENKSCKTRQVIYCDIYINNLHFVFLPKFHDFLHNYCVLG